MHPGLSAGGMSGSPSPEENRDGGNKIYRRTVSVRFGALKRPVGCVRTQARPLEAVAAPMALEICLYAGIARPRAKPAALREHTVEKLVVERDLGSRSYEGVPGKTL